MVLVSWISHGSGLSNVKKNMDFPLRRMMEQLKLEKASRVVKSTGDGEVHGFRGIDIGETLGPSKIQI
jgi:hypothetical protein